MVTDKLSAPREYELSSARADKLMIQGRNRIARAAYVKIVQKYGATPFACAQIALTWLEEGKPAEAAKWARRGQRIEPDDPLVLWALIQAQTRLGRLKEAESLARRILGWSVYRIGTWETGHGDAWASSLKNDCRFWMAEVSERKRDLVAARRWLRLHRKFRKDLPYSDVTVAQIEDLKLRVDS